LNAILGALIKEEPVTQEEVIVKEEFPTTISA
jgi:hypothetical protein